MYFHGYILIFLVSVTIFFFNIVLFILSLYLCGVSVVALICSSWKLPFSFERIYCWPLCFKSFCFWVLCIWVLQGICWWWPSVTCVLVVRLLFFFFNFFPFLFFLSCMSLQIYKIVLILVYFSCCRYGNVHPLKVPVDVHLVYSFTCTILDMFTCILRFLFSIKYCGVEFCQAYLHGFTRHTSHLCKMHPTMQKGIPCWCPISNIVPLFSSRHRNHDQRHHCYHHSLVSSSSAG